MQNNACNAVYRNLTISTDSLMLSYYYQLMGKHLGPYMK